MEGLRQAAVRKKDLVLLMQIPHRAGCLQLIFRLALTSLLALSLPVFAAPGATPAASYRFGVFPYMAHRQTIEFFGPVAANMEAALKHPVTLESVPSFPDFTRALKAQSYDIALIQPFDYPEVVEKQGYIPLAQISVPLVSQFYVRDDSRYRKIEDLRGTTIAMPPAEAATTRMALCALYDHQLIPGRDVEVRNFTSHDSCIQQVWAGSASACGTARPRVDVFEQRMQARLRAIYDTPPLPHIMFVAHPRVPAAHRAQLQQLITGWNQSDAGRALLKNLGYPGFLLPKPAEYVKMRNFDPVAAVVKEEAAAGKELLFGVFPYLPARRLAQGYAPALAALRRASAMNVHLRTAASFISFNEAIASAKYDIILVQPFAYALATAHGYLPLAGMKGRIQGSFFVLEASPYQNIADFKGKEVAMPPAEAALSRIGLSALIQAGLTPGRDVAIKYVGNHDSCIQAVQRSLVAACVTAPVTLEMLPKELTKGLRAVGQTETVPGILLMAHKRLASRMREKIQAEIIGWKDTQAGREMLNSIHLGDLVAVDIADYQRLTEGRR